MLTIHTQDSLIVDFPVSFPSTGNIQSLTGAVVVVSAAPALGGATVAGTHVIVSNTITATFPAASFTSGVWRLQVKVTISGEVQTFEVTFTVMPSNT